MMATEPKLKRDGTPDKRYNSKPKPKKTTNNLNKPNYKVDKQKVIELHKQNVPNSVIAEVVNCTPGNITQLLKDTKQEEQAIKQYQAEKVNILQLKQAQLVNKLNPADIKISTARDYKDATIAVCAIEDKIRLMSGLSTANIGIAVHQGQAEQLDSTDMDTPQHIVDTTNDSK